MPSAIKIVDGSTQKSEVDSKQDPHEDDVEDQGSSHSTHLSGPESKTDNKTKDGAKENLPEAVDEIQRQLGGFGRYQIMIFLLLGIIYMRGGWHVWVPIFQGITPDHHCKIDGGLTLNESIPWDKEDGKFVLDSCRQYVNKSISNETEPCRNGWTYDQSSKYTSIVPEFDLVCEDDYLVELSTTIYMVGTTSAVVFLTPLADRFGAKTVMFAFLWIQAVFGTCLIWSGNIVVFMVIKFFIGLCNMIIFLSSYMLRTEIFDATRRETPTLALEMFWALGIMSMALLGYLLPSWKDLELTISLSVNVLSLTFIFIIPDSLPWLLTNGKVRQAESVIKRYLRINKLPDIPDLKEKLKKFEQKKTGKSKSADECERKKTEFQINDNDPLGAVKSDKEESANEEGHIKPEDHVPIYSLWTLFKTKRLAFHSLTIFYLFLVNALVYFGIMYSTPDLNGNRFLNLFLLGVVEIPATLISVIANRKIGRRRSLAIFYFVSGSANLAVLFIPDETDDGTSLTALKTTLIILGKFGITGTYSTSYLYASEIFPTVIRHQAVGSASFFENIGSIAAPNMIYVNDSLKNLPIAIFGGLALVSWVLVLLLPETHNRPLPQTLEDMERMTLKQPK